MRKREEPIVRVSIDVPVSLHKLLQREIRKNPNRLYGAQRNILLQAIKDFLKKKGYKI